MKPIIAESGVRSSCDITRPETALRAARRLGLEARTAQLDVRAMLFGHVPENRDTRIDRTLRVRTGALFSTRCGDARRLRSISIISPMMT